MNRKGIIENRIMILFNGQIISSSSNDEENEIIKFEQLNIDLSVLSTTTIKQPKLQELSTLELSKCFISKNLNLEMCEENVKKEIIPILIRRLILPFYIPVISLICSFLLLKNQKIYSNKTSIFIYGFVILVLTELLIRYTGLNYPLRFFYSILPFLLSLLFYFLLFYNFSKEAKKS